MVLLLSRHRDLVLYAQGSGVIVEYPYYCRQLQALGLSLHGTGLLNQAVTVQGQQAPDPYHCHGLGLNPSGAHSIHLKLPAQGCDVKGVFFQHVFEPGHVCQLNVMNVHVQFGLCGPVTKFFYQVRIHLRCKFLYVFILCHHLVTNHTNGNNHKNAPTVNSTVINILYFIILFLGFPEHDPDSVRLLRDKRTHRDQ